MSAGDPFLVGLGGNNAINGDTDTVPIMQASGIPISTAPAFGNVFETPAGAAVPVIATPGIDTGSVGGLIASLASTGLSAWKTQLQSNLLQSQINHGQQPSIVAGPNGTPSAPFSTTSAAGIFSAGTAASPFSSSLLLYAVGFIILLAVLRK